MKDAKHRRSCARTTSRAISLNRELTDQDRPRMKELSYYPSKHELGIKYPTVKLQSAPGRA
jgi:hypothetical protein